MPEQREKPDSRFDEVEALLQKYHTQMIQQLTDKENVTILETVDCMKMAADLHVLFPKDPIRFSLMLQRLFQTAIQGARRDHNYQKMWNLALCLKMLDPSEPDALGKEDLKNLLESLKDTIGGNLAFSVSQMAQTLRMLFPNEPLPEPEEIRRIETKRLSDSVTAVEFGKRAAGLRILFKDPIVCSDDKWNLMLERLYEDISIRSFFTMADLAVDMKILAAEEVRIPEGGGLELIIHKPKTETKEPIPPQPTASEL